MKTCDKDCPREINEGTNQLLRRVREAGKEEACREWHLTCDMLFEGIYIICIIVITLAKMRKLLSQYVQEKFCKLMYVHLLT